MKGRSGRSPRSVKAHNKVRGAPTKRNAIKRTSVRSYTSDAQQTSQPKQAKKQLTNHDIYSLPVDERPYHIRARQERHHAFRDVLLAATPNMNDVLSGTPRKKTEDTLKPVYPFPIHAVDPITGDYFTRPGAKAPGIIDLDAPLTQQILEYKRRIVTNYHAVPDKSAVIGDPAVLNSRMTSHRERALMLFDDDIRPFLNRKTRMSPIYKDTVPELRTPRTPLPADTGLTISPTTGILHAYRLHALRVYLSEKKQRRLWAEDLPFENVYDYDSKIAEIPGALDQAGVQEFMDYAKSVACSHNSNLVPQDTRMFMSGIKRILPLIAKTSHVEAVKVRRRKK